MSAFPPKADIAERRLDVRFVPKGDSCAAATRETSTLGYKLGLASLTDGTVPPLPFQSPPLSSSRPKQGRMFVWHR